MPYIDPHRRVALADWDIPQNVGELNFVITRLCIDYLDRLGKDYSAINGVIGVLECAKQEFYRRIAAPYEDDKIQTNGDVYS